VWGLTIVQHSPVDSDEVWNLAAQARLDRLAKPAGSLGRLEELARDLARTQGRLDPRVRPRRLVIFAADHGVATMGVSAWPQAVSRAVALAIQEGVAASAVLARQSETECLLVDVGLLGEPLPEHPGTWHRRLGAGSGKLPIEPALSESQFLQAFEIGREQAKESAGCPIVAGGEVGIGNTTIAAALTGYLLGLPAEACVGPGAGLGPGGLPAKQAVVEQSLRMVESRFSGKFLASAAALCGWEIAALCGFYTQASRQQQTIVLDGAIATSAALLAERLSPGVRQAFVAAHQSTEPAHRYQLEALGLRPYLTDWGLRLGEGTGALLLMPWLDAARAILCDMATLDDLAGPTAAMTHRSERVPCSD